MRSTEADGSECLTEIHDRPMPHVVHLTTVHVPFDTRIFHKECRTLVEAGYRVSLITSHPRHGPVDGVELIPVPRYSSRAARMTAGTWSVFRLARALQADLYHFHDPELLPMGVLLKQTTDGRVIYDAHENYARQLGARGWMPDALRGVLPRAAGMVEQASARSFDAVVCATEHIAALFPATRTVVVKNYPFRAAAEAEPDPRQYAPGNYQLIYTGGWSGHRGVYQIVQALGHVTLPDARLTLLGRCVDPGVQQQAMQLQGYARVDYHGMVPYDRLYQHMRSSAVGMICSQPQHDYDMAQPNKLFEYMSAGLPVIASNFPLWREVVEGSHCGLTVDPTRPQDIAEAIDRLLAAPQLRREMGENGRQAVLQTYNWNPEGQKLVQLYKELLH